LSACWTIHRHVCSSLLSGRTVFSLQSPRSSRVPPALTLRPPPSLSLSLSNCLSSLPPRAPPLRKSTLSRSYAPSWVFRVTYGPTHDADGCTGGPALEVPGVNLTRVALALAFLCPFFLLNLQPGRISRWPTPARIYLSGLSRSFQTSKACCAREIFRTFKRETSQHSQVTGRTRP